MGKIEAEYAALEHAHGLLLDEREDACDIIVQLVNCHADSDLESCGPYEDALRFLRAYGGERYKLLGPTPRADFDALHDDADSLDETR